MNSNRLLFIALLTTQAAMADISSPESNGVPGWLAWALGYVCGIDQPFHTK